MNHINNFRGAAILLIVFTHCLSIFDPTPEPLKLLDAAVGNDTIYFVAIAGYLFSHTSDDYQYGRFMLGKLKAVFVPYLLLSIPAILIYTTGLKTQHAWIDMEWFASLNPAFKVGFLYITGAHLGPLWFVPMIMTLFAITPLLVPMRNRAPYLAVALVLAAIGGLIAGRPQTDNVPELEVFYFLPAFILGMLLAARPKIYRAGARFALPAALCVLVVSGSVYLLDAASYDVKIRLHLLIELVMTVCLFSLFHAHMNRHNRWLDLFARISFFVFFVHGYFIAAFRIVEAKFLHGLPYYITLPAYFAVAVAASVFSFVVMKIILRDRSRSLIAA